MVAVLEVPDSPTRSTGLFIFTICSRIQLALVVSTVGTKAKMEGEEFKSIFTYYIVILRKLDLSSQNLSLPSISEYFMSWL